MTDNWILLDLDKHILHRNRVLLLIPQENVPTYCQSLKSKSTPYLKRIVAIPKNWSLPIFSYK